MGWQWRGITHDDVPAWNQLLSEAEKVDETGEHYNEGDLHEELDDTAVGPADRVAAWVGERMVAYAAVRPREAITTYWRIDAAGTVEPGHRGQGLGERGLSWIGQRAATLQQERHPGTETRVHVGAQLDNLDQVTLLETAGYAAVNWSATMRVELTGPVDGPVPALPTGYSLRGYDLDWSVRTLRAHNAAFTEHWAFVPWTAAMWNQWEDASRNARHGMSWLALPDDDAETVAGYVLTHEYDAYEQVTGRREAYLAKIGVRPEHRGRGLASALLRHALHSYAAAGYDESALDVDTDNPTGAFQLYERVGYQVETRTATYERVLPAVANRDEV